jgi:DNA-binding beta-propeller fold protein YncE
LLCSVLLTTLLAAGLGGAVAQSPGLQYVFEPVLESLGGGSLAVSPDGRNLYVLGGVDNRTRLAVVARDPHSGTLSRPPGTASCVRPWYLHSTRCRVGPGLNNSSAITVSPDGRDVAIGAYPVPQLALYRREAGGGLHPRSCQGDPVPGYACWPVRGLAGVVDLAFSPDGRNLYVAGRRDVGGLFVLARDPTTGAMRQLPGASGCFQRQGRLNPERPPCAVVPAEWYVPTTILVTADGGTLLTDSSALKPEGIGIFVFHRSKSTGALTPLTCYVIDPVPPCEQDPLGTHGAGSRVVTPDGRTLIEANAEKLVVLALDPPTGELTQRLCLARVAAPGCERAPKPNFESLELAPNGRRLFAGDQDAIRTYTIRTDGSLAPGACVSAVRLAGCALVPEPARATGFGPLMSSPDGRWLYSSSGHVLAFRILG